MCTLQTLFRATCVVGGAADEAGAEVGEEEDMVDPGELTGGIRAQGEARGLAITAGSRWLGWYRRSIAGRRECSF